MKDPRLKLAKEYIRILNGHLLLGALNVPVYNTVVPDTASAPYVIYSTVNLGPSRNPNRTYYGYVAAVLLDIVTSYAGGFGSKIDSVSITDQIKQLLMPGGPATPRPIDLAPDFKVIVTTHLSDTEIDSSNETRRVIRNLARFEHTIEEIG